MCLENESWNFVEFDQVLMAVLYETVFFPTLEFLEL